MGRIFSGVQRRAICIWAIYLAPIRNWVRLQREHDCIFCIVDMHAITIWAGSGRTQGPDPRVTAAFLAAGVDAKKHIVFNQSQVPAMPNWPGSSTAGTAGLAEPDDQFKEKSGKDRENASVGLYVYPNLMAADILAYRATMCGGEDQRQHLELARDIAQKSTTISARRDSFRCPNR